MWKAHVIAGSLLLSLACSFASGSRALPPKWEHEAITVSATVTNDLVREVRLGKYVARFEETSLHEIQGKIGAGSLEQDGDGAAAITWLCYSLPGQLVWFVSTEMDGAEDDIM